MTSFKRLTLSSISPFVPTTVVSSANSIQSIRISFASPLPPFSHPFTRKRTPWHPLPYHPLLLPTLCAPRLQCLPHHSLGVDVKQDWRRGAPFPQTPRRHPSFTQPLPAFHPRCTQSSLADTLAFPNIALSYHTSLTNSTMLAYSLSDTLSSDPTVLHTAIHPHSYHSLHHSLATCSPPHPSEYAASLAPHRRWTFLFLKPA